MPNFNVHLLLPSSGTFSRKIPSSIIRIDHNFLIVYKITRFSSKPNIIPLIRKFLFTNPSPLSSCDRTGFWTCVFGPNSSFTYYTCCTSVRPPLSAQHYRRLSEHNNTLAVRHTAVRSTYITWCIEPTYKWRSVLRAQIETCTCFVLQRQVQCY